MEIINVMKRLIASCLLLAAITCGLFATVRAQTIGCGNSIFGKLELFNRANAQSIAVPCGASGAPFTPASLPGLAYWYSADVGVFSDAGVTPATNGAVVNQWNDRSGRGCNLSSGTIGNGPTFNTTTFNGHQGLLFNGNAGQILNNTSCVVNSATLSVFMLINTNTNSGTFGRLISFVGQNSGSDFNQTNSFEIDQPGGGTQTIEAESNSTSFGNGGAAVPFSFGTPQSYGLILDGANVNTYAAFTVQGAATAFSSTIGGASPSMLAMGTFSTALQQAIPGATIAEIVFTTSALNSTQRSQLQTYFQNKWGAS